MTVDSPPRFRTVSFGDLDGRHWGAAIDAGLPAIVFGASGATGAAAGAPAVRFSEDEQGGWTVSGDGFDLLVIADGDGAAPGRAGRILDERCRVSGRLVVDGNEHQLDCAGTRSSADDLRPHEVGSVRGVAGWFDDDHALSLLAFRPRDSADQEADLITATVFEPGGPIAVDEPRLSTTYAPGGQPLRASLELWIGEGDDQFPRRAAGEAFGADGEIDVDGLKLRVTPLRCHSRGLDGAGAYLLAQF